MSENKEYLNNLATEMQKFREAFSGLMEDTQKSRISLEKIESVLNDQSKTTVEIRDEVVNSKPDSNVEAPITYSGFDSDDMKQAAEMNTALAEKLKQQHEEAEAEAEEYKSSKTNEELLHNQEKSNEMQMKTNDYLRILSKLTEENNKFTKSKTNDKEERGMLSRSSDFIGKGYGVAEGMFVKSGIKGSRIGGGIGEAMGGVREIFGAMKKGFSFVKEFKSRQRQDKLKGLTGDINREKAILSAERDRLDILRKEGGSDKDIDDARNRILLGTHNIREYSKEFGDLTSKEYMHQKARSNKGYRKLDDDVKQSMTDQISRNVASSVTRDIDGNPDAPSGKIPVKYSKDYIDFKAKLESNEHKKETELDKRRRKNELLSEMQSLPKPKSVNDSMSNDNNPSERFLNYSKQGGMLGGLTGGVKDFISRKDDSGSVDREMKLQSKSLLTSPITPTKNPKSLGQYVAGIYEELEDLNNSFDNLKDIAKKSEKPDSDGGIFSNMFSGLLGGLSGMLIGKFKGLLKLTTKPFSKITNILSKVFSKEAIKSTAKVTSKMATNGVGKVSKGIGKMISKMISKGGAKSLAKKIPGLGLLLGLGFGASRLMDGDFLGAAGEVASGAASTIPGSGTAASFGIDAALIARDIKKENELPESPDLINEDFFGGYVPPKSSFGIRNSKQVNDVERTRPVINTMTTMKNVDSVISKDQMNAMQIQARLFAVEMAKLYKSDDYQLMQKNMSKNQANHMKNVTYG